MFLKKDILVDFGKFIDVQNKCIRVGICLDEYDGERVDTITFKFRPFRWIRGGFNIVNVPNNAVKPFSVGNISGKYLLVSDNGEAPFMSSHLKHDNTALIQGLLNQIDSLRIKVGAGDLRLREAQEGVVEQLKLEREKSKALGLRPISKLGKMDYFKRGGDEFD